jgi:hypothetical protein
MKRLKPQESLPGWSVWEIEDKDLWKIAGNHSYDVGDVLIFTTDNIRQIALGEEFGKTDNPAAAFELIDAHLTGIALSPLAPDPLQVLPEALARKDEALDQLSLTSHIELADIRAHADASIKVLQERYERAEMELARKTERVAVLEAKSQADQSLLADAQCKINALSLERMGMQDVLDGRTQEDAELKQLLSITTERNEQLEIEVGELREELVDERTASAALDAELTLSASDLAAQQQESLSTQMMLAQAKEELLRKEARIATLEYTLAHSPTETPAEEAGRPMTAYQTSEGIVTVYHEFPKVQKKHVARYFFAMLRHVFFLLLAAGVIVYIIYTVWMFDSMRASGVPVSDFSHAILGHIKGFFGL